MMFNKSVYYALILLMLPITAAATEYAENSALDPKAPEIMSTTSTFLNRFSDVVIEGDVLTKMNYTTWFEGD